MKELSSPHSNPLISSGHLIHTAEDNQKMYLKYEERQVLKRWYLREYGDLEAHDPFVSREKLERIFNSEEDHMPQYLSTTINNLFLIGVRREWTHESSTGILPESIIDKRKRKHRERIKAKHCLINPNWWDRWNGNEDL